MASRSRRVVIEFIGKDTSVNRTADRIEGRMTRLGGTLGTIGKRAGLGLAGGVAYGVGAVMKSSVGLEAQFGQTMSLIGAATSAPKAQLKELNDLAIDLGAKTSFSANEAAEAMLELAKAGLTTKDIMGGGVAGTLTLAAAGGTDMATSATIAANAMNTFNLRGKDMERIAAALAGGANSSSASVESLAQGLAQVGPGARNAGLSLEDTVGALAAFDSAGIKGSDAGTSLKTMLARLVPSTDKAAVAMEQLGLDFTDAQGNFVPLTNVAQQLKEKLSGLSEEQRTQAMNTIFGSDATRAATVLMNNGAKGLGKYIAATKDAGAAQRMAEARMAGTKGAIERMNGALETARLKIGQGLAPAVTAGANLVANKLVPAFMGLFSMGDKAGPQLDKIKQVVGRVLGGLKADLGKTFADVKVIFSSAISIITSLWNTFGGTIIATAQRAFGAIRQIVRGGFTVIRGIFQFWSNLLKGNWSGVWAAMKTILSGAWKALGGIVRLGWAAVRATFGLAGDAIKGIFRGVWTDLKGIAERGWQRVQDFVAGIPGKIRNLGGAMRDAGGHLIGKFLDGLRNMGGIIGDLAGDIWGAIKDKLNSAIDAINEAIPNKIGPINLPNNPFPHFAKGGTMQRSGLAVVGEEGPELVHLPGGARVYSNKDSVGMAQGLGAGAAGGYYVIDLRLDGKTLQRLLLKEKRRGGGLELGIS